MRSFLTIIKLDYITRIRSYSFLITLCATLAISYTFVPEPNAGYSTIRIGDYVGNYNSAWFGYVTAMMSSVFLSLIGFYLVNNSIQKDIKTKVGQILATTRIKNFSYLLSRVFSNFLVLITIVCITFSMSILLFVLYNDEFDFEILQFVKPYVIIALPAIFWISVLGVLFEVIIGRYTVIQNILFFALFSFLLLFSSQDKMKYNLDVFGSKIVMNAMEESVRELLPTHKTSKMTIGYVLGNTSKAKKFNFDGIDFPFSFITSRLGWIFFGILLIAIVTPFFHRFNTKERTSSRKRKQHMVSSFGPREVLLSQLPKPQIDQSILPLIKTELFLLMRKGNKWLWMINAIGMILLAFLNIDITHQMVLPILWFLQVHRLSDLTTKELENDVFYFTFSAFRPLRRILISQILAGVILMIGLAFPLLFLYGCLLDINALMSILLGAIFIVFLAMFLGIFTQSKKLFEVLFFFITYANINKIPVFDYFGGISPDTTQILYVSALILGLGTMSFLKRRSDLRK